MAQLPLKQGYGPTPVKAGLNLYHRPQHAFYPQMHRLPLQATPRGLPVYAMATRKPARAARQPYRLGRAARALELTLVLTWL